MQPLPPTITTSIFHDAANGFQAAASKLGSADAAAALDAAARLSYQGIPSLRMTTTRDSGSREVATALGAAADAAMALAKEMRSAPAGTDFSAHKDAIIGWSNLAADAAFLVEPAAFGF
ncbi:MAG: hypothetical protein JWL76_1577 [Thermoleophilia bacterium]|nr:hypothetical protein [Thermoleophilia bacterium]